MELFGENNFQITKAANNGTIVKKFDANTILSQSSILKKSLLLQLNNCLDAGMAKPHPAAQRLRVKAAKLIRTPPGETLGTSGETAGETREETPSKRERAKQALRNFAAKLGNWRLSHQQKRRRKWNKSPEGEWMETTEIENSVSLEYDDKSKNLRPEKRRKLVKTLFKRKSTKFQVVPIQTLPRSLQHLYPGKCTGFRPALGIDAQFWGGLNPWASEKSMCSWASEKCMGTEKPLLDGNGPEKPGSDSSNNCTMQSVDLPAMIPEALTNATSKPPSKPSSAKPPSKPSSESPPTESLFPRLRNVSERPTTRQSSKETTKEDITNLRANLKSRKNEKVISYEEPEDKVPINILNEPILTEMKEKLQGNVRVEEGFARKEPEVLYCPLTLLNYREFDSCRIFDDLESFLKQTGFSEPERLNIDNSPMELKNDLSDNFGKVLELMDKTKKNVLDPTTKAYAEFVFSALCTRKRMMEIIKYGKKVTKMLFSAKRSISESMENSDKILELTEMIATLEEMRKRCTCKYQEYRQQFKSKLSFLSKRVNQTKELCGEIMKSAGNIDKNGNLDRSQRLEWTRGKKSFQNCLLNFESSDFVFLESSLRRCLTKLDDLNKHCTELSNKLLSAHNNLSLSLI